MTVEKMRDANLFDPVEMHKEFSAQAEKTLRQIQQVPAMLLKRGRKLAEQAQADYDASPTAASRSWNAPHPAVHQGLGAQLDNTVSITKGAMTTARNAVMETERAARDTVKTGIDEVEGVGVKLAQTAREDVEVARTSVREATARTRAAANRTSGVAQSGARNTSSRAKATATSARKSASKAGAAANAAAEKVG